MKFLIYISATKVQGEKIKKYPRKYVFCILSYKTYFRGCFNVWKIS